MIIYKRKPTSEDVANLDMEEELIYYKSDEIALCINYVDDRYLVRKKQISSNELLYDKILKTIDEVMEFIKREDANDL